MACSSRSDRDTDNRDARCLSTSLIDFSAMTLRAILQVRHIGFLIEAAEVERRISCGQNLADLPHDLVALVTVRDSVEHFRDTVILRLIHTSLLCIPDPVL